MNAKERVSATFRHEPTDRIAVMHLGFSSSVASALLGREAYVGGGIQQWREAVAWWQGNDAHEEFVERSLQDAIDMALYCEHDIVRVNYWRYRPRPTRRIDAFTFMYEHGPVENWRVLKYDPPSEQCHIYRCVPEAQRTFEDLERQLDFEAAALAEYEPSEACFANEFEARRRLRDQYAIRLSAAHIDVGLEPIWMEATIARRDLVERKLDLQVERGAKDIRFLAANGFRLVFGGGDFATNDGPLYSPRFFREVVFPRVKQMADLAHAQGCRLGFDSDGNLWTVAEDLFGRSGVDCYYEIDRRAGMDLPTLRERFPRLTLIGNINSTDVATLSREEVVAQTRECVEFAKSTRGVVVGCSNYFVPGTPMENVHAVLDTIHRYR